MKTILLVEDDSFISDLYSVSLKGDYKIDIAKDGQMALDKIKDNCPDLLMLDINLPKVNGCEILKVLRDDPKTKNLKVIVLSNYNENDINEKYNCDVSSFGVIKFFLKVETPVNEIKKAIKEILQ